MERERLTRKLNSVGKEAFVIHYHLFKEYANNRITKEMAIQKLVGKGRSNQAGASIRLGNAKSIFSEKGNGEALIMVQESKLPEEIRELAKTIHEEDCK